jgi:hypothetical protein
VSPVFPLGQHVLGSLIGKEEHISRAVAFASKKLFHIQDKEKPPGYKLDVLAFILSDNVGVGLVREGVERLDDGVRPKSNVGIGVMHSVTHANQIFHQGYFDPAELNECVSSNSH